MKIIKQKDHFDLRITSTKTTVKVRHVEFDYGVVVEREKLKGLIEFLQKELEKK